MARKPSLLNATMRLAREIEKENNRKIREENRRIRQQQQAIRQRQAEQKRLERQRLQEQKEIAIADAESETLDAENARLRLQAILEDCININTEIDWSMQKSTAQFTVPYPKEPKLISHPEKPSKEDLDLKINLVEKIFKPLKKKKELKIQNVLDEKLQKWNEEVNDINNENIKLQIDFEESVSLWKEKKELFEDEKKSHNSYIDEKIKLLKNYDKEMVNQYFTDVILGTHYEDFFNKEFILDYNDENKILIIDYEMPNKENIPNLKTCKYVVSRKEFKETYLKEKDINNIYDNIIFQLTLRVTYELYTSDKYDALNTIVFNGIYNGINLANGKEESKCIISLQTNKKDFLEINIENVDPKKCFIALKGTANSKLNELVAIQPLMRIEKPQNKFVEGYNVCENIEGVNLAAMDWKDFENLIRELFEKMYKGDGVEVNITQASRDGGIDAVIYDPDIIKGGKTIIQAKRYTNTVNVSAVRDLSGTVQHEGANRGILVTTSNFGGDSYEFIKDKPLTLINGNELLHYLEEQGYSARIDINEAKKMLK